MKIIGVCDKIPNLVGNITTQKNITFWSGSKIDSMEIEDVDRALAAGEISESEAADLKKKIDAYDKALAYAEKNIKHFTAYLLLLAAEEYSKGCPSLQETPKKVQELNNTIRENYWEPAEKLHKMYIKQNNAEKIPFDDIYQQYLDMFTNNNLNKKLIVKKTELIRKLFELFRWNIKRIHNVWYVCDRVLR